MKLKYLRSHKGVTQKEVSRALCEVFFFPFLHMSKGNIDPLVFDQQSSSVQEQCIPLSVALLGSIEKTDNTAKRN